MGRKYCPFCKGILKLHSYHKPANTAFCVGTEETPGCRVIHYDKYWKQWRKGAYTSETHSLSPEEWDALTIEERKHLTSKEHREKKREDREIEDAIKSMASSKRDRVFPGGYSERFKEEITKWANENQRKVQFMS